MHIHSWSRARMRTQRQTRKCACKDARGKANAPVVTRAQEPIDSHTFLFLSPWPTYTHACTHTHPLSAQTTRVCMSVNNEVGLTGKLMRKGSPAVEGSLLQGVCSHGASLGTEETNMDTLVSLLLHFRKHDAHENLWKHFFISFFIPVSFCLIPVYLTHAHTLTISLIHMTNEYIHDIFIRDAGIS